MSAAPDGGTAYAARMKTIALIRHAESLANAGQATLMPAGIALTENGRRQAAEFAARTAAGHRLLFFPEGTSTDGRQVLPFKPTLFQAFLDPALPPDIAVQPVSVRYEAPPGRPAGFYGWWGDMALGPRLLAVLAQRPQGCVTVTLHPPIPVAGHDRKSLAAGAMAAVRSAAPMPGPGADPQLLTPAPDPSP